ncbi:MAG: hypothetical protein K2P79_09375, partial [Sphingomonas sp.]|nr:hypothetical protein [Sphingomonas sp.]
AWRATPGLHRVTTERRDLFRRPLLADELGRSDAAVIDPPRAGAEAQAIAGGMSARGTAFLLLPVGTLARIASGGGNGGAATDR